MGAVWKTHGGLGFALVLGAVLALWPEAAQAQDGALNGANTAWILTSTALVLFMTLPGLALFYAGLMQARNVLSVMMHCFAICCMASLLWLVVAYSLAFGDGGALQPIVGGLGKAFLAGVGWEGMSGDIPENLFFMFQMTFAIITPALIVGAYPERVKFSAVLLFSGAWLILVYAPVTHWVWGGGWLSDLGVMDFAGGLVVHATAGTSALVFAALLGTRNGFPRHLSPPHSPGMVMIGASMLWVGWFGFNAGMAMAVTHISAATASLVWVVIEWKKFGKPSLVGVVTGMVAGLATITPASGFVGPLGGFCIGLAGGVICYLAVDVIKHRFGIDDSLDVFAVHGVGGITGTLLTAVFGAASLGGIGLAEGTSVGSQFGVQAIGAVAVVAWSVIASFVILKICAATVGLRVTDDEANEGLDLAYHGESGYNL